MTEVVKNGTKFKTTNGKVMEIKVRKKDGGRVDYQVVNTKTGKVKLIDYAYTQKTLDKTLERLNFKEYVN